MSKTQLNKFRKDPRLAASAAKAGCTPEEFLGRICKNAGIRSEKKLTK